MTTSSSGNAARLRITLLDLDPEPWREVEVPLSMSFKGLHDTIQAAFLWTNSHLWEFDYGGERYGIPFEDDSEVHKAENAQLTKLTDGAVDAFFYIYDMGDSWEHRIEVLDLFTAASDAPPLPRFVDGKWRTPPEDIGGAPGFELFLEAIDDPGHEDHEDVIDWYGASFDREDIQPDIIGYAMARLSARRRRR